MTHVSMSRDLGSVGADNGHCGLFGAAFVMGGSFAARYLAAAVNHAKCPILRELSMIVRTLTCAVVTGVAVGSVSARAEVGLTRNRP